MWRSKEVQLLQHTTTDNLECYGCCTAILSEMQVDIALDQVLWLYGQTTTHPWNHYGNMDDNYKMKNTIDDILQCMNQANITPVHCNREANQVADYLSKIVSNTSESKMYMSFYLLPREIKRTFILDKFQVPSIRTKYNKENFFVS